MASTYVTEGDVEAKLLQPLFHQTLGYPDAEMAWKRSVTFNFGRERLTKQADLIVSLHGKPVIAVEAKRPTEAIQSGISQVDSYAQALETPYSIVTNGKQFVLRGYYSFNSKINIINESIEDLSRGSWTKLVNLIAFKNIGASLGEKLNYVAPPNEEKIRDYRRFFRKIHNAIRDREKLDPAAAFDELSKLLFLKAAEDELRTSDKNKAGLVLTPEKILDWEQLGKGKASEFVNNWFDTVTSNLFPGVFGDHPKIELKSSTLVDILKMMEPFHVKNGDVDVKGRAFEEFLPSQLRGEGLGQFFTPRPVVNFMAEMASISIHDVVVDFACGSGGFLIKAFERMKDRIEAMPIGTLRRLGLDPKRMLEDVKARQIFGIDAEPRAARTAKMNMLMWGDGKQVVRGNSLATTDHNGDPYSPTEYSRNDPHSGCTLILANPPFGSKEKEAEVLDRYILGTKLRAKKVAKGKNAKGTSERTEILFLEKGLKLLRPEGRMLIVIPQGILSGRTYARVRNYIRSEAEIRAIVSLPTHTFVQSGVPTVNTCVLYLQKFTEDKKALFRKKMSNLPEDHVLAAMRGDPDFDYSIFMGTAEFVGYEPSGRATGEPGEPTDLDLLLQDFTEQDTLSNRGTDLFDFASLHYGEKSGLRREQTIRGTARGLKTSFVVPFSQTEERLDPPYYFFRHQASSLIGGLKSLDKSIVKSGPKWRPTTEEELDSEFPILSVSSDGKLTVNEFRRGENLTGGGGKKGKTKAKVKAEVTSQEMDDARSGAAKKAAKPTAYKKVIEGDIVYNPMRINIGSIGCVSKEQEGSLVSPDYVVFRSNDLDPPFLVNLLRSPFYRMYIDVVTTGSIRDRLLFDDLRTLRVPDIRDSEQIVACEYVRRVDEEIGGMVRKIASERAKAVNRLHDLIVPPTPDISSPEAATSSFRALADQWRDETGMQSSITRKLKHPAYLKILAMGDIAVPLILKELANRPGHWFEALKAITGENPVQAVDRADVRKAAAAWLAWGKAKGYTA